MSGCDVRKKLEEVFYGSTYSGTPRHKEQVLDALLDLGIAGDRVAQLHESPGLDWQQRRAAQTHLAMASSKVRRLLGGNCDED